MTGPIEIVTHEVFTQEYSGNNCMFEFGIVEGHPVDTIYLKMSKDGVEPHTLLLRRDEAMIIVHGLSGALWSEEMARTFGEGVDVNEIGDRAAEFLSKALA